MEHRKTDIALTRPAADSPVMGRQVDYPLGWRVAAHVHARHQLIHAVRGVMVVEAPVGCWVVPPNRAIWMHAGMTHAIRCVGVVQLRSLMVSPELGARLPEATCAVAVSPLLRELLCAAMAVRHPYSPSTRDGRIMRLALDELRDLAVQPLHLRMPTEPRVAQVALRLQEHPDDASTLADWARRLSVDIKTIQRGFSRQTGMTFGQWRQQARLLKALELLAEGQKVIDVALATGYESPSAFSAVFRDHFGTTPKQFFADQ